MNWVNIITNFVGIGSMLLLAGWFFNRLIKQIDKRLDQQDEKSESIEEEIKKVIDDKNQYKVANASIISKLETQYNNILDSIKKLERKIFKE